MKREKSYRLKKIQAARTKGKFKCPECDRAFKTALARTAHGVRMHGWRSHMFAHDEGYQHAA